MTPTKALTDAEVFALLQGQPITSAPTKITRPAKPWTPRYDRCQGPCHEISPCLMEWSDDGDKRSRVWLCPPCWQAAKSSYVVTVTTEMSPRLFEV